MSFCNIIDLFYTILYNKHMKRLIVEEKYNEKKLNTYLFAKFPNLKQNTLYKALRKKDIKINNKRISENITIYTGDEIQIFIIDELLSPSDINSSTISVSSNLTNFNLDIIYEDTNILIINKPSNIEVTGDANCLTNLVKQFCKSKNENFAQPCHRLDRNTTGLVLFAKNEEALSILLEKFKHKQIEKHYLATVYGLLKKKQDRLISYLFKDKKKSIVYISDIPKKGYVKIITSYKVLEENKKENYSTLDINLETGRTHQIRAHFSHIGHPIIGDGKYGINEINKKFKKKTQMLCSYKIQFNFSTDSGILNYLNGRCWTL